jgi:hypothetical protein
MVLTSDEKSERSNVYRTFREDEQRLINNRGKVYMLIIGQCTQTLKDKLKEDADWQTISDGYDSIRLLALVTVSEGMSFAQDGKKKKGDKNKAKTDAKDPKDFDKEFWKDKECYRCGKKGHPANACSVKPPKAEDDDDKSKSGSKANKDVIRSLKVAGKALAQLGEAR